MNKILLILFTHSLSLRPTGLVSVSRSCSTAGWWISSLEHLNICLRLCHHSISIRPSLQRSRHPPSPKHTSITQTPPSHECSSASSPWWKTERCASASTDAHILRLYYLKSLKHFETSLHQPELVSNPLLSVWMSCFKPNEGLSFCIFINNARKMIYCFYCIICSCILV